MFGALIGGLLSSHAASDAANAQASAANRATDLQRQMYEQGRSDQEPWRQAGLSALGKMGDPDFQRDFSAQDFQADPGYAFRMQQGQQALERSAAARGGLMGGGFAKALSDYGQNSASQEYQNAYNRFNNDRSTRFSRLSSIAGMGQGATNAMGQMGSNYANQAGEDMIGAGNAIASGKIGQANAWTGALNNIEKMGTDAISGGMGGGGGSWMGKSLSSLSQGQQAPSPSYGGLGYGGKGYF